MRHRVLPLFPRQREASRFSLANRIGQTGLNLLPWLVASALVLLGYTVLPLSEVSRDTLAARVGEMTLLADPALK